MLSPSSSHEGREDHDYHLQLSEDDESNDGVDLPARRRLNHNRENTDHDYLAAQDATEEVRDAEPVDIDAISDDVEIIEPDPVVVVEPAQDAEEQEARDSTAASTSSGRNPGGVINLDTPTPPKKRKRVSVRMSRSNTPKVKARNLDDEDDGLTCPICLDCWEMNGEHRLVSLKCGHLFGDSCIRRWLLESARQSGTKACPQCKSKAFPKDIRFLYAKRLRALDRSEEHLLRTQLDDERATANNLKNQLSGLNMSYTLVLKKLEDLEADNRRMKQLLRNGGEVGFNYNYDSKPRLRLNYYKLFMEKNIEISREAGCRVMIYSEKQNCVIISQKSAQNLFPGYGLRFIDTPSFRPATFLHASTKLIRDIALSGDQNIVAVASMETRTKLFDLRTRQVSAVIAPSEQALWACALDRNERENLLYLGAQHGSTYVYDMRNPGTIVDEYKAECDLSPVINVQPVPISKNFPCGGFIVCKLQSVWFFEYSTAGGSVTPHRLIVEGPFISMNYDIDHETLLVSARSNQSYPQSRYILGKLERVDDQPVFSVKVSFFGSKATPVMTRCSQIAVESNTLIAGYIQDVKLLALFDAYREQRLQSMPVQDVVYDTCPIYMKDSTYLAALTETKCRIYKLSPNT